MDEGTERFLDEAVDAAGAMQALAAEAVRDVPHYPTGFPSVDKRGTVSAGELALIWARSSCGKTTLALNVVARSPRVPTVIVSQEMPAHQIASWLLCMVNHFPFEAHHLPSVIAGKHGERWQSVAQEAMDNYPEHFPNLHVRRLAKPPDVGTLVRVCDDIAIDTEVAPQRIVIDHLGLLAGSRDYEGMSANTAALKAWAMRDGIAVWAIQQTGRTGDAKNKNDGHLPVTLSSGVYAGEHDADMIYGVYRPDKDPKFRDNEVGPAWEAVAGKSRFSIVKNRATGQTDLDGQWLKYDAASHRYTEPTERIADIPGIRPMPEPRKAPTR